MSFFPRNHAGPLKGPSLFCALTTRFELCAASDLSHKNQNHLSLTQFKCALLPSQSCKAKGTFSQPSLWIQSCPFRSSCTMLWIRSSEKETLTSSAGLRMAWLSKCLTSLFSPRSSCPDTFLIRARSSLFIASLVFMALSASRVHTSTRILSEVTN